MIKYVPVNQFTQRPLRDYADRVISEFTRLFDSMPFGFRESLKSKYTISDKGILICEFVGWPLSIPELVDRFKNDKRMFEIVTSKPISSHKAAGGVVVLALEVRLEEHFIDEIEARNIVEDMLRVMEVPKDEDQLSGNA